MGRRLLFIVLLAISLTSQGLPSNISRIDSLKRLERSAPHDTVRLRLLSEVAIAYSDSAYPTSIEFWRKALAIANKLKDRQQMGDIHHQIGYVLYNQGEFSSSLQEYKNALSVYQFIGNKQEVARVYNDIGLVYKTWGRYELAIENFLSGLRLFEEIGDEEGVGMISNNVGQIYFFKEDYQTAINYFTKYLVANEKSNHPRAVAGASNNIAAAYVELSNYDLALHHYSKALNIYDSLGVAIGVAIVSDNIGMLHTNIKSYPEALDYHFKALKLFKSINSQSRLSYTLKNIGVAYFMLGDYDNSNKYLLEAIDIASLYQQKETEKEIYFHLSNVYEAKKQPEKALHYYKQMTALKDSLFNVETNQNIASMELQFEAEKKERELKYFQHRIEQQKVLRVVSGSIILIFIAIIIALAHDNKRKRKLIDQTLKRKAFLLKTLEHTLANQSQNLPNRTRSTLQLSTLPKPAENERGIAVASYSHGANHIVIALSTPKSDVPLVAIKSFLLNELQKRLREPGEISNEDIVELIRHKLLYTIDLFDLDKEEDISTSILVADEKTCRIIFQSNQQVLWIHPWNGKLMLCNKDTVKQEKVNENDILLFPITTYDNLRLFEFGEYLAKIANTISGNNLNSRLEVLSNAIVSWNLSETTSNQMQLLALRVGCNQPLSIFIKS